MRPLEKVIGSWGTANSIQVVEGDMAGSTLFVYGSFVDGQVHYKKIAQFVESKRPAQAKGSVYRLEVGFPVFSADERVNVRGYLVELVESNVVLNILDEFHGFNPQAAEKSLFHRVPLNVEVDGEGTVQTFVYSINAAKLPKTARLIEDGDWEREISQVAPLTNGLTENQRRYIQKLGASSGRDIVPIQLELYRELLNKGLIVDKGRRLALTALGKEVHRYLDE